MPEVICNASPLQYLHQLDLLHVLQAFTDHIIVPPAVVRELAVSRTQGVNLPDPTTLEWVTVRQPTSTPVLPLVTDLGPGETEVLALALESTDAVVILDDALARQMAAILDMRFRGTLGLRLDAKHVGLISTITPLLDQLQALRFRLSPRTREAIPRLGRGNALNPSGEHHRPYPLVVGQKINHRTQYPLGDKGCRSRIAQRDNLLKDSRC